MRDTDYAYCVARVRAAQSNMLTKDDLLKLSSFENLESAVRFLTEKKWITKEENSIREYTQSQKELLWKLLSESVPDKKELDILCVHNDFFNIKVAVKCLITSTSPENYFVTPTTLNLRNLQDKIKERDFTSALGEKFRKAQNAYETAVKSENGQSAEIIIDRAAIECMAEFSKAKGDSITRKVNAFICDTSNIKIALRCAMVGKDKAFISSAVGECCNISREKLIENAVKGTDALFDYISYTDYADAVVEFKQSGSDFEKWCDEKVIEIASESRYTAFSFSPVCCYYYKKLNEIKNVSMILTAISAGADMDNIKERIGSINV